MIRTTIVLISLLFAAGCAPSAGLLHSGAVSPDAAGFWKGLWHGFIVLFTFVISLFRDDVGIYEVHNTGALYNLGFVLGAMCFFGGSGGNACRKKN